MHSSLLCRPTSFSVLGSLTSVRWHTGYIPFEGRLTPKDTDERRASAQLRVTNLLPVKRITCSVDPFRSDAQGTRDFMSWMHYRKIRDTNPKCILKNEIRSDGADPYVRVELADDSQKDLLFKSGTLTGLQIITEMNQRLSPLIREKVSEAETKATKKKMGDGKGSKPGKTKKRL